MASVFGFASFLQELPGFGIPFSSSKLNTIRHTKCPMCSVSMCLVLLVEFSRTVVDDGSIFFCVVATVPGNLRNSPKAVVRLDQCSCWLVGSRSFFNKQCFILLPMCWVVVVSLSLCCCCLLLLLLVVVVVLLVLLPLLLSLFRLSQAFRG